MCGNGSGTKALAQLALIMRGVLQDACGGGKYRARRLVARKDGKVEPPKAAVQVSGRDTPMAAQKGL